MPDVLDPIKVSAWRRRIQGALDATKPAITDGKVNIERYKGKYLAARTTEDTICVPSDFYYIEQKRAQLFYRLPDVFVKPEQPGLDDASVVFQAALNKKLGPQGINILPRVKQVLFDVLCPTGFGALKVGYETFVDGEVPLDVAGVPQSVPNIVEGRYFGEHIPPGDLLVPPDYIGTDFDSAPWIGMRFKEDVPDDVQGGNDREDDERRLSPLPQGAQAAKPRQKTGYEIWYQASRFDPDIKHPDKVRTFKVYDDEPTEVPVIVQDSPYQQTAPSGKLLRGMRGYPIVPLTLRYVSDTWMAPSDCTMARAIADELSKGRTQMVRARDRNLPQWGFDATRVDKDIQAKIERNEVGSGIPFSGAGADATWPIQKGTGLKETYTFNEVAQQDLSRIWRMGSNQIGVLEDRKRTATEQQITATSAQDAQEADRSVVLDWYIKVVSKTSALMQMFADETEFVELVGADAQRLKSVPPEIQQQAQAAGQDARVLVPWNKQAIEGLFSFSVKPNSQLYIDAAQERQQLMQMYQFFANNPFVNQAQLTREIITRFDFDPSKVMQQPPPKQSGPPSVSLAVKGEDFNPMNPQAPVVLDAMNKLGIPIDLNAIQASMQLAQQMQAQITAAQALDRPPQTEHGGAAATAEPLSKHALDKTGGMQGSGAPAPLGAGGLH